MVVAINFWFLIFINIVGGRLSVFLKTVVSLPSLIATLICKFSSKKATQPRKNSSKKRRQTLLHAACWAELNRINKN